MLEYKKGNNKEKEKENTKKKKGRGIKCTNIRK